MVLGLYGNLGNEGCCDEPAVGELNDVLGISFPWESGHESWMEVMGGGADLDGIVFFCLGPDEIKIWTCYCLLSLLNGVLAPARILIMRDGIAARIDSIQRAHYARWYHRKDR